MTDTYLTRNTDPDSVGGTIYSLSDGTIVGSITYLTGASRFGPRFNLVRRGMAKEAMFQNPGFFHSLEAAEYHLLAAVIEVTEAKRLGERYAAALEDFTGEVRRELGGYFTPDYPWEALFKVDDSARNAADYFRKEKGLTA